MKRVLVEGISILILSLLITLLYNAASPSGIIMLKKAFRIRAAIGNTNVPGFTDKHIIKSSYSVAAKPAFVLTYSISALP